MRGLDPLIETRLRRIEAENRRLRWIARFVVMLRFEGGFGSWWIEYFETHRLHLSGAGTRVRSQLRVGDVFTSCNVWLCEGDLLELGKVYDVSIGVLFWNEYGHLFYDAMPVELFEGSKIVARGEFSEKMSR